MIRKSFSPVLWFVFFSFWRCHLKYKSLMFWWFNLSLFSFVAYDLYVVSKKQFPYLRLWSFIVLALTFGSMIPSYFMWYRGAISLFFMQVSGWLQHHLWKYFSSPLNYFDPLVENELTVLIKFISQFSILFYWSLYLSLYQYYPFNYYRFVVCF